MKAGGILLQVDSKENADVLSRHSLDSIGALANVNRSFRNTPVLVTSIPDWMEDKEVKDHLRAFDLSLATVPITIRDNSGDGKVAFLRVSMNTVG
jgi:hypothetical protein